MMKKKLYEVTFEKLSGEDPELVLAENFSEAYRVAEKLLGDLNEELEEDRDDRHPDDIGSIKYLGEMANP